MTDLEQRVAERLRELAGRAAPHDPAAVLAAVTVAGRARRRRIVRGIAGSALTVVLAAAVLLVGSGTDGPGPDNSPAAGTPAAADRIRPPLLDVPPRGSLVGDEDLLADVAARSWDEGTAGTGQQGGPDPSDRRVVYAGDVPGGHRWAVVVGRSGDRWLYAWFAGPAGAGPDELALAAPVQELSGSAPLALMDISALTAPLVVLGRPGDEADYSPGTERAPDGTLVRDRTRLPQVDGVPTGTVPAPIAWDSGEVVLLRSGLRTIIPLLTTGTPPEPAVTWGPHSADPAVYAGCLAPLGIEARVQPDGSVLTTVPGDGQLSSAEQAARNAALMRCQALSTGGG